MGITQIAGIIWIDNQPYMVIGGCPDEDSKENKKRGQGKNFSNIPLGIWWFRGDKEGV